MHNQPCSIRLAILSLTLGCASTVSAAILYQSGANESNFIPLGNSGTPNHPNPGTEIAAQISAEGSDLTQITATFGTNNSTGNPTSQTDIYTLRLFSNDGAPDPNGSGLLGPGTLIYETSVSSSNAGGIYAITFATPVSVPATFILSLSSSHPTDTFAGPAGLVGPLSTVSAPQIGTSLNNLWFKSNQPGGWGTNSTWAIADGASTNYLSLKIEGNPGSPVPEPQSAHLLVFATGCLFGCRILRSKGSSAD